MPIDSTSPPNLEEKVKEALETVADDLRGKGAKNKPWTKAVKDKLGAVGGSIGYEACATGMGYHGAEIVCDLMWIKRDEGAILDLFMAMECEWGIEQEIYDFQKLLLTRADLKVMVFQGNRLHRESLVKDMKMQIDRFGKTLDGDRYLFACWDLGQKANERDFIYESYSARKSTP